jgi:SOS-response transcriptional repressor LexA
VVREVVYVALGVTPSGERRVLGYWLLPAESALGWEGVLGELWQRGLRRVLLFITDGLPGLPEAIRRVYPQAEWQRCVVHGVRWSLGQVRARDRTLLAEDLRRVYGAESRGEALEALEALREAWGSRYPGVVALWAGDSGAFLRFYGYPKRFSGLLMAPPKGGGGRDGQPMPDWALAIKKRRQELGMSQEDLAYRSGLSQSTISLIERGIQNPLRLSVGHFYALLRALEWGLHSFVEATGLEIPEAFYSKADALPASVKFVPILGSATGGKPFEYPIPRSLYRPGSAVYEVQGDSMDDGTERAIRDGDLVLVDTNLTELRPGKVYVVEILGDGLTVKEARKLNGEWLLIPWNPQHPPLWAEEVRVLGEVYAVSRYRPFRG